MADRLIARDDVTGRDKSVPQPQAQALLNVEDDASSNDVARTNSNAGAITQGMAVYADGTGSVDLADARTTSTFAKATLAGLVNEASIASSASGKIAVVGPVVVPSGLQVGTWTAGQTIYLDETTPGEMTNVGPSDAGEFWSPVGRCVNTPGGGDAIVVLRPENPAQAL